VEQLLSCILELAPSFGGIFRGMVQKVEGR